MRAVLQRCGAVLAVSAAASVFVPAVADAYTHSWSCSRNSGNRCTDASGTLYNPWLQVFGIMSDLSNASEVCAKAETAAGNQRSPLGTNLCSNNVIFHNTCFNGSAPDSRAYVYWGGAGGARTIEGDADTPATSAC